MRKHNIDYIIYAILNQAFNTIYTSTYTKFYVSFFSDYVNRRRVVFNFLYEVFTKTCILSIIVSYNLYVY